MPKDNSEKGTDNAVAADDSPRPWDLAPPKGEPSSRRFRGRVIGATERDRMLKEARDIDFPIGLRGYERAAVDRYVESVNRMIAELEMSASPESAVRHALGEVSEETRDILQHAHQTADEITARSRAKADDRLKQAEREAQETLNSAQQAAEDTREAARRAAMEIREAAQSEARKLLEVTKCDAQNLRERAQREAAELQETTMHEMSELREAAVRESQQVRAAAQREADELLGNARREAGEMLERADTRLGELARSAEAIWRERRRLIDDMRAVGEELVAIGEVEARRFPHLVEGLALGDEDRRERASAASRTAPQEPTKT